MRAILLALLALLPQDAPRQLQPELERLDKQAFSPGYLALSADFSDPDSWKALLAVPRGLDLAGQVGVEEGRLWLGTPGPRMSFEAGLQGLEAVRQLALEVTLDPGKGVATILLGIEPDGTRFRLDFREGPAFSVGLVGPQGSRFLLEPRQHRALKSFPARIGLLRTEDRLWVWSRGALLAFLKRDTASSRVGLQVSSGAESGERVFFDDLALSALVETSRIAGFVQEAPQGPPLAGIPVFCSWPGRGEPQAIASGADGSFAFVVPAGPLVKVWTALEGTATAWVAVSWPPSARPEPQELLLLPGQNRRLGVRHPSPAILRFSRTGLPELPRGEPDSRPAESRPAESRPAETRAAESGPAETRPAQSGPARGEAQSRPAESRPAEESR